MNIELRTVEDIKILDSKGKITLGEGTSAIRHRVHDILESGSGKIILNLSDVNYIDSAGVGELIAAYTSVSNRGGKLKLLNLTKKLHELLAITKLLTVFDVFDSEKAAIDSFR
jgi:anti-sigma B factor antagonist